MPPHVTLWDKWRRVPRADPKALRSVDATNHLRPIPYARVALCVFGTTGSVPPPGRAGAAGIAGLPAPPGRQAAALPMTDLRKVRSNMGGQLTTHASR